MAPKEAHRNFAYFTPFEGPKKGMFVVLETPDRVASSVVFGNKGLDWQEDANRLNHLWIRGEIGEQELRTEAEAEKQAEEMGLSLSDAKALLIAKHTKGYGAAPVIVASEPSLEDRAAKYRTVG